MNKTTKIFLIGFIASMVLKSGFSFGFTDVVEEIKKNPNEVIDDYLAAVGGLEKISGIRNMVMVMEAGIQGMTLEISATSDQENRRLMQQTSMEGNVMQKTVIKDGKGYISAMGQKQVLEEGQLEIASTQIFVFPEMHYKDLGYTMELGEPSEVEGEAVYSLSITTSQGLATTEYFSQSTGLKLMTESEQAGNIVYSDYKEVDGIKIPMKLTISNQMLPMPMEANVVSVLFNQELEDSIFE